MQIPHENSQPTSNLVEQTLKFQFPFPIIDSRSTERNASLSLS